MTEIEKHLKRIKIRRGTNSQRKKVFLEDGELVFLTDTKKIYVGDMETCGGIRVSNNNLVVTNNNIKPIQADVGDILYNKLA